MCGVEKVRYSAPLPQEGASGEGALWRCLAVASSRAVDASRDERAQKVVQSGYRYLGDPVEPYRIRPQGLLQLTERVFIVPGSLLFLRNFQA